MKQEHDEDLELWIMRENDTESCQDEEDTELCQDCCPRCKGTGCNYCLMLEW